MDKTRSTWRDVVTKIALIILVGAILFVVYILITIVIARNSPCKDSSSCPIGRTCDGKTKKCVALPGYNCKVNGDCSVYAPTCQPQGHYCTNISSQDRGSAGNPPRPQGNVCDTGLVLNTLVNLCQQVLLGAVCTINAQCNQGVCDKTCKFGGACSTDTALNPYQCSPGYSCDYDTLTCAIPNSIPGGNGTECNSDNDCVKGARCVAGPPGSGWKGVCRTGQLTWLDTVTDANNTQCITPLVSGGTDWCRYDIAQFMFCVSPGDCQFPYSFCNRKQLCAPATGETDPIDDALTTGLRYLPVGFNASGVVSGAFFIADYPTLPAAEDNSTGGKIITPYYKFLDSPSFAANPLFEGRPLVTFSLTSAFTIFSLASVSNPPAPPQTPYHTAFFPDPNPYIATATIIRTSNNARSSLWFSFYNSDNFSIMYKLIGGVDFATAGAVIWNPASIRADLGVEFIQNPIVTPWINVVGDGPPETQFLTAHALFYADNCYHIGIYYLDFAAGDGSGIIKVANIDGSVMTTDDLILTSWDAITTRVQNGPITTLILLYGLQPSTGNMILYLLSFSLTATTGNVIPVTLANVPMETLTLTTHCRFSRTVQQRAEPLIIMTLFYVVPSAVSTALAMRMFAISSISTSIDVDPTACSGIYLQTGVTALRFVTSVTGAYNYGGFCVWCATEQTRSAFLVVQIYASCKDPKTGPFWGQPSFSAIYWRRLTGDPQPDNYYLYPIGGASLPYFLAVQSTPLTFNGDPNFTPK
jgi:hypothetical protein